MSSQPQPRPITPHEYLERERRAETKSEFYPGEIFAMSGASRRHNRIATNCIAAFANALRHRDCDVFGSDMRIATTASGLYTYPDLSLSCGEPQFVDHQFDTLLNPILIIEVLSPSTKDCDRGSKFELYRSIPSLRDYILIAQDHIHVEHFARQPNSDWLLHESNHLEDTLVIPSLELAIPLTEIYRRVDFPTSLPDTP